MRSHPREIEPADNLIYVHDAFNRAAGLLRMLLSTLDIALRAGTVALLLVLAASLLSGFRSVVAGRLAAAFALGSAAHAASYAIGPTLPVSGWHAPLIALSTGNVVVFWLFTRALFDETFKLRASHGLVWATVAAFSFVNCMWI